MTLSKLTRFRIRCSLAAAVALLLIALFSATATAAAADGWDAPVVAKLANELEATMNDLYEQSLDTPPQKTALQQRTRDAAQGDIGRARDLTAEYAKRMRDGWTRAQSEPTFRAVLEAVAQVRKTGDDAKPAEKAKPQLARLESILDELRQRYDAASRPVAGSELR